MNKRVISIIKYTISLSVAGGLFYYLYGDKNMDKLWEDVKDADPFWVAVSIATALFSHWSRAARWVIALKPLGYQTRKTTAFLAVMVGYFANFFVPRLGEVMRCGIFNKTEKVPVNISFGAVIAERALDLIILLTLTASVVLIEFDKIGNFVVQQFSDNSDAMTSKLIALGILGVLGLASLVFLYLIRNWLAKQPLLIKLKEFALGMKDGLLSIRKLNKKEQVLYILHTLNIWVMYFFMSYVLFFSWESTENLSAMCGLTVLIMGGIGMALPSPGGVGTYHLLVATALASYGLDKNTGESFALLMHSSQTLAIVFVGGISFLISLFIAKKRAKAEEELVEAKTEA